MMNSNGLSSFPILAGWVLHWAFGTLWIIGAVLLIVWAVKYLKSGGLKSLAWWLFGIGVAGALFTAPFSLAGWQQLGGSLTSGSMMERGMMAVDSGMMGRMMDMMQRHDTNAPEEERSEHGEMQDLFEQMMGGNASNGWRDGMMPENSTR